MPAHVIDEPLGISCVFSDGSAKVVSLGERSHMPLARQLLAAIAGLVHPHGQLDSGRTIEAYLTAMRVVLQILEGLGFSGGAEDLTKAQIAQLLMQVNHKTEGPARIVLRHLDDSRNVLKPVARELLDGKMYNPNLRINRKSLPPYTESEWSRLMETCRSLVDGSFERYRHSRRLADSGGDPLVSGWSEASVQWLLLQQGPRPAHDLLDADVRRCRNRPDAVPSDIYPTGVGEGLAGLFPTTDVVKAYQVLFATYTGLVPDGLSDLGVDGVEWAGDATVLLSYVKGRTSAESLTLSARATRLLEQWLEHSSVARTHAPADLRGELWVRYVPTGKDRWCRGTALTSGSAPKWVRRHRLLDDAGEPLKLHSHRLRTSFESLRDRRNWHGSTRATIDPNHSPQVEGDHYLAVATPAQQAAVDSIIEDAQNDMIRRAQPPTILDSEDAAEFAERHPALVQGLNLDDAVIADLLAGERDVFTAACADQLSGLHGPKGRPCPARPWVCLLCPLALFAPRHLPNLLRLKAFFARQWKQMPSAHFMAVFGPYASRLDQIITPSFFSPKALALAAAQVVDTDDELPLRPEETTA